MMAWRRVVVPAMAGLLVWALASSASGTAALPAFHPRAGAALCLVPPLTTSGGGTPAGGCRAGAYRLSSSAAADSIADTDPYPGVSDQCVSPSGAFACVTDAQVQAELDKIAPADERGLHNLWYVFVPPD